MNKTKMTLAVTGGVIGLAVLVMAYFTWGAYSSRTAAIEGDDVEGIDGLDTVVSRAQTLSRSPVYPCAASITAIDSNRTLVAQWRDEAAKLASRGDKAFPATTPAAFKTFIVADAKRLASLPGTVNGALVKPEFAFGPFKDYIAEGKMPVEAQLAELQRKWDDVATVVETLANSGIAELVDVQVKEKAEEKEQANRGNGQKKAKGKAQKEAAFSPSSFSYVFTFTTRPVGFVKAVNALETCERFVVVEDFSFTRGKDVIAEALGGDEKKAEAQQGGRGRRGRRAAIVEEKKDEGESEAKNGIITDPLLDEPFTVTMSVTVHDFKSMEEAGATEEEKK